MSTSNTTSSFETERDRTGRFAEARGIERSVIVLVAGIALMSWLMATALGHRDAPETPSVDEESVVPVETSPITIGL